MNIHKFMLFKNIFIILINYNYLKYLLFIYLYHEINILKKNKKKKKKKNFKKKKKN